MWVDPWGFSRYFLIWIQLLFNKREVPTPSFFIVVVPILVDPSGSQGFLRNSTVLLFEIILESQWESNYNPAVSSFNVYCPTLTNSHKCIWFNRRVRGPYTAAIDSIDICNCFPQSFSTLDGLLQVVLWIANLSSWLGQELLLMEFWLLSRLVRIVFTFSKFTFNNNTYNKKKLKVPIKVYTKKRN